jgi:putative two-component system response regulator
MGNSDLQATPFAIDQLKEDARDVAEVYKSEKQKSEELKAAYQQLIKYADELAKTSSELRIANQELEQAYLDTIHRLVIAAEYKDEDTGDHIARISRYSALMAEKLGMSPEEVNNIRYAAPMHDVGKIGIPDGILMKSGRSTDEEFALIKTHPTIGAKILGNSKAELLQLAQQIALSHHEKWNGEGYPQGLAGEDIPLAARIVGLLDVFDALTSRRPYKDPYPIEVACAIIKKEHGQHFDPHMVDVFLENVDEISKIKVEVSSARNVSLPDIFWSQRDRLEAEKEGDKP